MLDPRFPWLAIGSLAGVAGAFTLYYGAVIMGLYKDPLLNSLRNYGQEPQHYPLCRFLYALSACSLLIASMIDSLTQTHASFANADYLTLILFVTSVAALGSSVIVRRSPVLRTLFPLWYADLMANTTRLERRMIAYAWLRLPRKMRWRLNGNRAAWRTWTDTVRITVIYGAQEASVTATRS